MFMFTVSNDVKVIKVDVSSRFNFFPKRSFQCYQSWYYFDYSN